MKTTLITLTTQPYPGPGRGSKGGKRRWGYTITDGGRSVAASQFRYKSEATAARARKAELAAYLVRS